MKFTVKTLNSMRYDFEVDENESVGKLKEMIEKKTNIDPARQKLIFLGKVLQDNKKLSEYKLDGKVIHMVESPQRDPAVDGASSSTAPSRPDPLPGGTSTQEQIGDQMINQIISSLGVDRSQARITRQNLPDGGIAVSLNVPDGVNEHFDIQIQNETVDSNNTTTSNTIGNTTTTTGNTTARNTTQGAPSNGTTNNRQRPPTADNLDRIINHLRAVRETMRHIPCGADQASDIINDTLVAPCIRRQHTSGPTVEEGATPEEVQQRQTSRESIETYSHIMIDMADIMQEMVRYMNQYARLLHHDPPLRGSDLSYAQNLVDRMSSMFHDVSHAFHILSDYGFTLNTEPPRRLWMATISGGASILLQRVNPEGGAGAPNIERMQERLRAALGGAQNTRGTTTTNIQTNTRGTSTAISRNTSSASSNSPRAATTNNAATVTNNIPTNNTGTSTTNAATNNTGTTTPNIQIDPNNPASFSISYNLPTMNFGANMSLRDMISQATTEGIQNIQQGGVFQGLNPPAAGAQRVVNSLQCNSRHHAFGQLPPCPIHNASPAPAPGHSHHAHTHGPSGHSHSHGPRPAGHSHSHGPRPAGHSHSHGPRPAGHSHSHGPRPTQATRQRQPNSTQAAVTRSGPRPRPDGRSATAPNIANNPMVSLLANSMSGFDNPGDLNRFVQLLMRITNNRDFSSQTISQFWPEVRDLIMPNVTFPDQSHLGDMLHIIGSNFTFSELMAAMNNHEMFDVLYRPMRTRLTQHLFNNQTPTQHEITATVNRIVNADRNLIVAFFDIQQSENTDVDEQETIISMVNEFIRAVIRELYSATRGDVAEGFGQAVGISFLRLVGLIMAYCRYINPEDSRNQLTNQFSGLLQTIIPYQTISRSDLYDNHVVHRSQDTTDDEFVDAQEHDESMETNEKEEKREELQPSPSMVVDEDEIPDEPVRSKSLPKKEVISNGLDSSVPQSTEIPAEWKRVIEEDVHKIDNTTYGPLSDGYLTSLPAKRRKTDIKRSGETPKEILKDLIKSSMPRSSNSTEADIEPDDELTELFSNKLKEDLKKKVKDNDDVNEEQFPSASKLRNG